MSAAAARPKIRVVVFWVYTALLAIATHIPNRALPQIEIRWFDKFEHVSAYGLWTLLLLMSGLLGDRPFKQKACLAVFWCVVLAVVDESLQMIPILNRVGDPLDIAADVVGSVCAVCVFWVMQRLRKSGSDRT